MGLVMKQVVVVLLLLFCCAQAQQYKYRVEFVLIADTCCGNVNSYIRRPDSVGVEYREAGSETWGSLQNLKNIES
jgi:hypothetical protein